MQYLVYSELNAEQCQALYRRPAAVEQEVIAARVAEMEVQVRRYGAVALEEFSRDLDGVALKRQDFEVLSGVWARAWQGLSPKLQDALQVALENIAKFHESELLRRREPFVETSVGVRCWREFRPIDSVGLYIPGGSAPLFSSMLMLGVPAIIAGCPMITFCSPPSKSELERGVYAAPEMLGCMHLLSEFARQKCGARSPELRYFQIGGAQAIFGMAYKAMVQRTMAQEVLAKQVEVSGRELGQERLGQKGLDEYSCGGCGLPSIYKIFGPGNSYVTEAKLRVSRYVAIDMLAGPSEVLIIAEKGQNPAIIAADLLAQAEHGPSSQVFLLSPDAGLLRSTEREVGKQLGELGQFGRANELQAALSNSYLIEVGSVEEALDFSNNYAPEHLILASADFEALLPLVRNAGSVFCGPNASESFGDYASGTNHTLPTAGFALSHSGVETGSFGRWLTFQSVGEQGLQVLGPKVEVLAEAEQLLAHKNAVTRRLQAQEVAVKKGGSF